mgnify:CR=1 FL=1
MKKIQRLRLEALDGCRFRGHNMSNFEYFYEHGEKTIAFSKCLKCKKEVGIWADPAPNGIDIAGEAVALGCTD